MSRIQSSKNWIRLVWSLPCRFTGWEHFKHYLVPTCIFIVFMTAAYNVVKFWNVHFNWFILSSASLVGKKNVPQINWHHNVVDFNVRQHHLIRLRLLVINRYLTDVKRREWHIFMYSTLNHNCRRYTVCENLFVKICVIFQTTIYSIRSTSPKEKIRLPVLHILQHARTRRWTNLENYLDVFFFTHGCQSSGKVCVMLCRSFQTMMVARAVYDH